MVGRSSALTLLVAGRIKCVPTLLVEGRARRRWPFCRLARCRLLHPASSFHHVAAAHRTAAADRRTPGRVMRSVPVPITSVPFASMTGPAHDRHSDAKRPCVRRVRHFRLRDRAGHLPVPAATNSGVRNKLRKSKTTICPIPWRGAPMPGTFDSLTFVSVPPATRNSSDAPTVVPFKASAPLSEPQFFLLCHSHLRSSSLGNFDPSRVLWYSSSPIPVN